MANSVFFERHSSLAHDPPHRPIARHHPSIAQLGDKPAKRHVRLCRQPPQQPFPFTRQRARLLATPRTRRCTPRHPQPLRPLHRTRDAHTKQPRRLSNRSPAYYRRRHPLPKIIRIRSRHPCQPPYPASRLNQNSPPLGIPNRFRSDESDSRGCGDSSGVDDGCGEVDHC